MSELYITSDTHFCHAKNFLWEPRGFKCVKDMNETIVEHWNNVVNRGDKVYHLGDIALTDTNAAIPYIKRLNGHIIWIRGNHDSDNRINAILAECPNIEMLSYYDWNASWATVIRDGKWRYYLSHYPTLTGNHEEWRKVVNLCGHSHTQDRWADWDKMCYHVEMDAHDCYPISLDQIKAEIKVKHDEEATTHKVPVLEVPK